MTYVSFRVFPHSFVATESFRISSWSQSGCDGLFHVAVGTMDPMTIPTNIACPTSTCFHKLSGGSSQTCMGDGNWDGEVPECRELDNNYTSTL